MFPGTYPSLIFKACLPLHIKTYKKSLMNKTGKISLLEIHSLCSETPSSHLFGLSFHDLVSLIIVYFLPAALAGT